MTLLEVISGLSVPEPPERAPVVSQLVEVRWRRWLVEEAHSGEKLNQLSRTRLACAQDGAQQGEIAVFWTCKTNRRIRRQAGRNELAARGFDTPRRFTVFPCRVRDSFSHPVAGSTPQADGTNDEPTRPTHRRPGRSAEGGRHRTPMDASDEGH